MTVVKSISELSNFLNGNMEKMLINERDFMRELEAQSTALEFLIKRAFMEYYDSYTPKVYKRTYNLVNSIQVNKPIVMGNTIIVSVGFNEHLVNHPSLWGGDDAYIAYELDTGWHIHWSKPFRIERLSDFDGFPWIQEVVKEYNENNPLNLKVQAFWDGEKLY